MNQRDFIIARSWRTFGKQQMVALAEICKILGPHAMDDDRCEIHLNINQPNPELQEQAFKLLPKNIKLFFYTNQDLENYCRKYGIEPNLENFKTWEWIYHILLYHKLYFEDGVNYLLTYDDDILFNADDFGDLIHLIAHKIPFSIADQYHDADKPMMGKLVERFGNEIFENYYRCGGNNRAGNSGFMGFNNSTMQYFSHSEGLNWLINSFTYKRWDHLTMQGVTWDTYKVLLQEQSLLSILNRAYSGLRHLLLLPIHGYVLNQDLEKMKQSKVMHFISTTKYEPYYLNQVEQRYEQLKHIHGIS